ncbi:Troponin [Trinorchestia longiramus]|nr:Troponin [Trinorchestia longiramus]
MSDEEEYSSEEESEEEDPAAEKAKAEVAKRQAAMLEAAKEKALDIEKKKADVRKRLEEQSQKKQKKGFMTPERKKKLRLLLRKKAAEELKKEQERKAAERRKIIDQRCGQPKNLEGANEDKLRSIIEEYHARISEIEDKKYDCEMDVMRKDYEAFYGGISAHFMTPCVIIFILAAKSYPVTFSYGLSVAHYHVHDVYVCFTCCTAMSFLSWATKLTIVDALTKYSIIEQLKAICKEYHERLFLCESQKWDLEYEVRRRDYEINELNIQVNDLRGKFIKPTLKKVSKYENKFAKLQKKAAEFNFRNQLKTVKKKEFELEDDKTDKQKPDWAAGTPGATKKEGEEGGAGEGEAGEAEGAPKTEGESAPEAAPQEPAPAEATEPPADAAPAEEVPAEAAPAGSAPAEGAEAAPEAAPSEAPPAEGEPAAPAGEEGPPAEGKVEEPVLSSFTATATV